MKYKACTSLFLLLLTSALLWAGDPWKEKPASLWTKKEVEKVLRKSPWVRPLVYPAGIPTRSPSSSIPLMNAQAEYDRQRIVRQQQIQGAQSIGARSVPVMTPAPPPRRGFAEDPDRGVRWLSSSVLQQAVVRARQLAGQTTAAGKPEDDGLRQFLALTRNCHLIGVGDLQWAVTPAPLLLARMSPPSFEEVRPTTYLELNPSKKKVFPFSAALVSTRFTLPSTLYCFPRELEGQPVVDAQETRAKFRWGRKKNGRQVEFNLTKMTRDGKPDL